MAEGLQSVRTSGDITMRTQITRTLLAEIQSSDWQLGPGYTEPEASVQLSDSIAFFDDQGIRLTNGNDPRLSYTARVTWQPGGVLLPGALHHLKPGSLRNPFSRKVTIRIASGPVRDSAFFDDPDVRHLIHTVHSVHTSRMPTAIPSL
jgi:uncharacterized protein (TIGR02598 family)